MGTAEMNLFIVDTDYRMSNDLKQYLSNRFGKYLNISKFQTGESCLKQINNETKLVILGFYLKGKDGNAILKSIKEINPDTEVIIHTSSEDVGTAIESYRNGALDYVLKGQGDKKHIGNIVLQILTYPIRIMVREFGISKFLAIFLLTFFTMALIVVFVLKAFVFV
jgi:DNA-binding NtrC family response regulator